MSESILIVVAIIVVAITVLGLAICVLAGYLARIPDSKVTIGEVGRAIGAIVGVGLEAVATIITSVRRPWVRSARVRLAPDRSIEARLGRSRGWFARQSFHALRSPRTK